MYEYDVKCDLYNSERLFLKYAASQMFKTKLEHRNTRANNKSW